MQQNSKSALFSMVCNKLKCISEFELASRCIPEYILRGHQQIPVLEYKESEGCLERMYLTQKPLLPNWGQQTTPKRAPTFSHLRVRVQSLAESKWEERKCNKQSKKGGRSVVRLICRDVVENQHPQCQGPPGARVHCLRGRLRKYLRISLRNYGFPKVFPKGRCRSQPCGGQRKVALKQSSYLRP